MEGVFGTENDNYKTFKEYAKGELNKVSEALDLTKKKQKKVNEDSKSSLKDLNKKLADDIANQLAGLT